MAIEDLLAKAYHTDIRERAENIQKALEGVRLELLAKHYAASLPEDKRKEFEALNPMEKQIRLAKNEYKLPGKHAEDFLQDIAYSVLYGVAPKKAEEMKKQLEILRNPASTPEQKADAHREIDHFMAIVQSYGVRMDQLEEGKEIGFGPELFDRAVKNYGATYLGKEQSYWIKQIDHNMANDYIKKIPSTHPDLAKFDVSKATHEDTPLEEKWKLIAGHYQAAKNAAEGGYKDFIKDREIKKYFKK